VAGTQVSLTFGRNGSVRAYAGCNHLSGSGRLAGGRLVMGQLSQTLIGCDRDRMNQDQWLASFLTAQPAWRLAGDQLELTGGAATLTLTTLTAAGPDRELTGTRWLVETVSTGRIVSSVPPSSGAHLTFDGSGRVSGSDGCAAITGTATVATATMTVVLVPPTQPCSGPAAAAAAAIRATLHGTVQYAISADTLKLTAQDGHELLLRAPG
jgi:heat shock protein HslJ